MPQTSFDKKYLEELKTRDINKLYELLKSSESSNVAFILKRLGRLPPNFDGKVLTSFLQSENDRIRFLTVKNLGKLENKKFLEELRKIMQKEKNSMVRREIVSAIGRMRTPDAIPFLIELLTDSDPKIVLQAIRALLPFRSEKTVEEELIRLKTHPNEMVQDVIKNLFETKEKIRPVVKHPESPDFMKNVVVWGDVREIIKQVPDESIHLTFTSPPYYNARDYSIYQSYKEYISFLASVFKDLLRVTKEGRFFILDTSPIIIPRMSRKNSSKRYPIPFDLHPYLVDMGWEFIDDIIWLKPEASAKNRNAGFLQHRKPLAYKPNAVTEYLMVYRKRTEKLIDWNIHQYDKKIIEDSKVHEEYETSNVWRIDPVFDKIHSAVFPLELCERVIKFYSYKGDLVFDPFAGIGTLGKAALKLGRYFFLTEIEEAYVEEMRKAFSYKLFAVDKHPGFIDLQEFARCRKESNYEINR